MARILLTGATGFVGGALLRWLVGDAHEVVALHGSRPPTATGAGIEWRRFDLLRASEAEVAELVEVTGASHCLHAAWYTNHADYLVAEINREWLAASLRLAAGFHAGGGGRFIGLGTCLEYDQKWNGRFSEAETPLRPETLYARCKTALFEHLLERSGEAERSFAWARIFFVYGPGDRAGRLIPYIVANLARGERVSAKFGGLRRDYIHVDDLAAQLARIAFSEVQGAINTGTGKAEKIADIFALAGKLAGHPELVDVNDLTGDGQGEVIEADMSRYRAEIGEPAARSLREGLAEIVRGQP